jgi:hypothetical protein
MNYDDFTAKLTIDGCILYSIHCDGLIVFM